MNANGRKWGWVVAVVLGLGCAPARGQWTNPNTNEVATSYAVMVDTNGVIQAPSNVTFQGTVQFAVHPVDIGTNLAVTATGRGEVYTVTTNGVEITAPTPFDGANFGVWARGDDDFSVWPSTNEAVWVVGAASALASNTAHAVTLGYAWVRWDGTYWLVLGD